MNNTPTSLRLNGKQKDMLKTLCDKYGKNRSQMIIFLIEKEYYFNKECDKNE